MLLILPLVTSSNPIESLSKRVIVNGSWTGTCSIGTNYENTQNVEIKADFAIENPDPSTLNCNGTDTNKDGKVDASDYITLKRNFGKPCSSPSWCDGADMNKDGRADWNDLQMFNSWNKSVKCISKFESIDEFWNTKDLVGKGEIFDTNMWDNTPKGSEIYNDGKIIPEFSLDCSSGCERNLLEGIDLYNALKNAGFYAPDCGLPTEDQLQAFINNIEPIESENKTVYNINGMIYSDSDKKLEGDITYTLIDPICKKGALNSSFKASIDARVDIKSKTEEEALLKTKDDLDLKLFDQDDDISLEVNVKSSEYKAKYLEENPSVEDKLNCSLPLWVEIEMKIGYVYYDDYLVGDINLNFEEILNKTRKIIENVTNKFAPFIEGAGGEYNDYFLNTDDIKGNLIGHHTDVFAFTDLIILPGIRKSHKDRPGDDSIKIEETITIRLEYVNDKVVMSVKDHAIGNPLNPKTYKSDYKKEKLKSQIEREGPQIKLVEGLASLHLYRGIIEELTKSIPESLRSIDALKQDSVQRVPENESESKKAYVKLFPLIEEDNLEDLIQYTQARKLCCREKVDEEKPETGVKTPILKDCPKKFDELRAGLSVSFDGEYSVLGGTIKYLEEKEDLGVKIDLYLRDIKYDSTDPLSQFNCGVPEKAELVIAIEGLYYDYISANVDFFSGSRDSFMKTFPPKEISYFFDKYFSQSQTPINQRNLLIDGDFIKQKVLEGDAIHTTDDSQRLFELISLKLTHTDEGIVLSISDYIMTDALKESDGLLNPNPFGKMPLTHEITIAKGEPGSSIIFEKIIESLVSSTYSLKGNPEFNSPFTKTSDGKIIKMTPTMKLADFDNLRIYSTYHKDPNCCCDKKTTPGSSTTSPGLSLYYIRDPSNYTLEGKGYIVTSSQEITENVTKSFIGAEEDWVIYRIDDEDIPYYNYTILGSSQGSNIYEHSHDGIFKVNFSDNPESIITIETIDLTGLKFIEEDSIYESTTLEESNASLKSVLLSAEKHVNEGSPYAEFMMEFFKWVLS